MRGTRSDFVVGPFYVRDVKWFPVRYGDSRKQFSKYDEERKAIESAWRLFQHPYYDYDCAPIYVKSGKGHKIIGYLTRDTVNAEHYLGRKYPSWADASYLRKNKDGGYSELAVGFGRNGKAEEIDVLTNRSRYPVKYFFYPEY